MNKTVANVIGDARGELKDVSSGNYTYSQADMARYCGEGILEMRRVRPSMRYSETLELLTDEDTWATIGESGLSTTLPIEDRYYADLVAYVIARCLSRDITDESNLAVAATWMKKFQQGLST